MTAHRTFPVWAVGVLVLAPLWSCGGDGGGGGPTATPAPVASVALSQDTATLVPTATVSLIATARGSSGDVLARPITWSSSDNARAAVSAAGVVTGVAAGPVTITATSEGRSAAAQIVVKDGAIVTPGGASTSGLGGVVALTFPAGAVNANVMVTMEAAANAPGHARLLAGSAVELAPSGRTFGAPVQLRIRYNAAALPVGALEAYLRIHRLVGGTWEEVAGNQIVDAANRTVSAEITSFSAYAVLATEPPPGIGLSAPGLNFSATQGGANPPGQAVSITNTGGGTLSDLSTGTITFGPGASGWLQAPALNSTTAPATVTIQPVTGSLAAGTYTATVPIQSSVAANSPQNLTITFTVAPAPPQITLSSPSLTFTAIQGGPNPASQSVTISNAGGGSLSGLGTGTTTYSTGASGWLEPPSLNTTTAPATLTVQTVTGTLAAGTYTAIIPVQSAVAANSPQNLAVTLTVTPPADPCAFASAQPIALGQTVTGALAATDCALSDGSFADLYRLVVASGTTIRIDLTSSLFNAFLFLIDAQGNVITADDNGGGGTNARISRTLIAGTYFIAANSFEPARFGAYQLQVQEVSVAPAIGISATSLTFNAVPGSNPASRTLTVTNEGGGTLSGLAASVTYTAGQPNNWLNLNLSGTTATATLTIQPLSSALPEGTYTATVSISSPVASNSPRTVTVTLHVAAPPVINLSPTLVSFVATAGGADPAAQNVSITNAGAGTLSGLSIHVTVGTQAWLTATLGSSTAPTNLSLQVQTGTLAPGTYTAVVTVQSSVPNVAPKFVTVVFVVQSSPSPSIGLSTTSVTFQASAGGSNPATQAVNITNIGSGSLTGLGFTLTHSSGQPGGWLSGSLSATVAPATLTLQATTGSLAAGSYTATATVSSTLAGVTARTIEVTFVVGGGGGSVAINTGDNQAAMAGAQVPVAPSVIVRDGSGVPLAGRSVTFTVNTGGGSITDAQATTNAGGIATIGGWTMGPMAGPNSITATVAGSDLTINSVVIKAVACEGGGGPAFEITLCFVTDMTASQRTAFLNAAARWSAVITGDLQNGQVTLATGTCGEGSPAVDMLVDDVIIHASVGPIDGPGQILGRAGPCFIRGSNKLPVLGAMVFDAADLAGLETAGQLPTVILHEMGHVLGIGPLWDIFALLQNRTPDGGPPLDTYFSGVNGTAGFDQIGGATYTAGQKVPVENTGGPGTANGHWRESVLANELMTGFLNTGVANPLSLLTVGSLQDLGYTVNANAADQFFLTLGLYEKIAGGPAPLHLGDDILRVPLYVIDENGRITRVR